MIAEKALRFAAAAHGGQVDKAGAPYIEHLIRVRDKLVEMFPDAAEEQQAAALLHDAIEDAGVSMQQLADEFGARVALAVVLVTRKRGARGDYLDFIARLALSGNEDAIRVKLADNADNLDPNRPVIAGGEKLREEKYLPARQMLLAILDGNPAGAIARAAFGVEPILTAQGWS